MSLCRFSLQTLTIFVLAYFVLPAASLFAQAANPIPFVNQPLVPASVEPGSAGFTLTVNGAGFVSSSVVSWDGAPLSTTVVSSHQLEASVPASYVASTSTAFVTVSSPVPGGGTSNSVPFTITTPTTSVTFAASLHAAPVTPGNLLVADFNGDGKSDLALLSSSAPSCNERSGAITILLGNGQGGFSKKSTICVYGDPITGVVGDFNNDGKLDMAVIASDGHELCGCAAITTYLGNGDGTFTEGANFYLDGDLFAIVAADFNGDGNLDMAISYVSLGVSNVAVFLGNGNGSFSPFASELSPAFLYSNSLLVGDFNNDGIVDLASVGAGSDDQFYSYGPVAIFLGNGDGTFTSATTQPDVTLSDPFTAMATAGDFNGDGILDMEVADASSTALTILKGNGDGTFTQVSGEPALPPSSTLMGMADFNGDGKLDLAYSTGPNMITLFLGNGDGTFQMGLSGTVNDVQFGGGGIGDFNGDGRLDLAMTNSSGNTISILRQTVVEPRVSVTLSSSQNPSTVNQPVTYTAAVSASPFSPTGTVTFKQGAIVLGTVPLADGEANLTTAFTKAGSFSVVAIYSGDENYRPRKSNVVTQVVQK